MKIWIILFGIFIGAVQSVIVSDQEWLAYKNKYQKQYDGLSDRRRRLNYGYNKYRIQLHNSRFTRNQISYELGVNQLTDLTDLEYNSMLGYQFRDTTINRPGPPSPPTNPPQFPPLPTQNWTSVGGVTPAKNQGLFCNAAWAYAANAALETKAFVTTGSLPILSEQELLDCAGGGEACTGRQTPRTAYDYIILTQSINTENAYPRNPSGRVGLCNPKDGFGASTPDVVLISENDDSELKRVVSFSGAVVVGYDPFSFEFRQYKSGLFVTPRSGRKDFSKYYMAIVGYGTDPLTNKQYWLLKNSLGQNWGELGYIRIEADPLYPIAKSAIYPL